MSYSSSNSRQSRVSFQYTDFWMKNPFLHRLLQFSYNEYDRTYVETLTSVGISRHSRACLTAVTGEPLTICKCSISLVNEARISQGNRESDMHCKTKSIGSSWLIFNS